jgi:hypothetical protein
MAVLINWIEHKKHNKNYGAPALNADEYSPFFIFPGSTAQCGLWPPRSRGFLITHNDAPQLLGTLWTSDQLAAETST